MRQPRITKTIRYTELTLLIADENTNQMFEKTYSVYGNVDKAIKRIDHSPIHVIREISQKSKVQLYEMNEETFAKYGTPIEHR